MSARRGFDAVIFDLLTAVLNSWKLWNEVAGSAKDGFRWRRAYLGLTYACGPYRPYEELVREAAELEHLRPELAADLVARWAKLEPWDEAPEVLGVLAGRVPLGVATNCSKALASIAVSATGIAFSGIVSAEEAGYYKPRPEPYRLVLKTLGVAPERTLFVAGSPADIGGAANVGMPVFWHNRARLPAIDDGVQPLLVSDSLKPLLELV